jgi:hypothetical protein
LSRRGVELVDELKQFDQNKYVASIIGRLSKLAELAPAPDKP